MVLLGKWEFWLLDRRTGREILQQEQRSLWKRKMLAILSSPEFKTNAASESEVGGLPKEVSWLDLPGLALEAGRGEC